MEAERCFVGEWVRAGLAFEMGWGWGKRAVGGGVRVAREVVLGAVWREVVSCEECE